MKIRFSTFLRDHGPFKRATDCTTPEWEQACAERRFMTVYHGENDWCNPVLGVVGHHGCVNTICKVVFTKPLPPGVTEVIGMRDNPAACALCNVDGDAIDYRRAMMAHAKPA